MRNTSSLIATRRQRRWVLGSILVAAASMLLYVGAEAIGLRPVPSARQARADLLQKWGRVHAYRAGVAAGNRASTFLTVVRGEQVWQRGGPFGMIEGDLAGFRSRALLEGNTWTVQYPESNLAGVYTLKDLDQVPFGRWAMTRVASIEDVIHVVESADDLKPEGWVLLPEGVRLVLRLTPKKPELPSAPKPLLEFYERNFGGPWRVFLDDRSGLPTEVRVRTGDRWDNGIRFTAIELLSDSQCAAMVEDFRGVGAVRSMRFSCSLLSEPSFYTAHEEVYSRASSFRQKLLRGEGFQQSRLPPGRSSSPGPR